VTASDLAAMGATIANGGVHPKTKKRVISAANCTKILAEMTLNGLYDSTGDWFYRTGLPAKSGVGGGILAIAPGRLSVAAFSPPLDEHGNSVRAQVAIGEIGQRLGLSILQQVALWRRCYRRGVRGYRVGSSTSDKRVDRPSRDARDDHDRYAALQ
jgi:glutaminase